jgi:Protein of unknown function (DUF3047)
VHRGFSLDAGGGRRGLSRVKPQSRAAGPQASRDNHEDPMNSRTIPQFGRVRMLSALALGACFALRAVAAGEPSITAFSSAAPGAPPAAWKFATLPNKAPTKYTVVELAGAKVLKVESDESYGNLVHGMRAKVSDRSALSWRWRVDKLIENADLKVRSGEDSAAKLCVFFGFDANKLSFSERTKLSLGRTTTGEDVPTQTLCYVWDNKLPPETFFQSAFTSRIRFLIVQSGSGSLGQWVSQRRDLVADYQRLFGDESEGKVPEVTGVSVSADSDNTKGKGLAYFGDITLTP